MAEAKKRDRRAWVCMVVVEMTFQTGDGQATRVLERGKACNEAAARASNEASNQTGKPAAIRRWIATEQYSRSRDRAAKA